MDVETLLAHAQGLRALARGLLRDEAQVDDVLQEACLAALDRPPGPGVPRRAWLARVVRNLALRRRREDARRERRERRAARRGHAAAPDDVVARAESHRLLVQALLALEEPYRSALLLRYFDGLSYRAIAERLGVPAGTVATHVHRGLARLRARLDETHGRDAQMLLATVLGPSLAAKHALSLGGAAVVSAKKTVSLVALLVLALTFLAGVLALRNGSGNPSRSGTPAMQAARPEPAPAAAPGDADVRPSVDLGTVDRDLDLHGVVVDASGSPVADARVETRWNPWRRARVGDIRASQPFESGPRTRSARDGTFALRLRRGQRVDLRVEADGCAPCEMTSVTAGARVRVVLREGVALRIRVTDHTGHPAAGARLRLSNRFDRAARERIERHGTTGTDGVCVFADLPPRGSAGLDGRHSDFGNLPWQQRIAFPATGTRTVEIAIPKGRTLDGVVLDGETGEPVPGARVSDSWTMDFCERTGADGRFALHGWGSDREFELSVVAEGYARAERRIGPEDDDLVFRLDGGSRVAGRVLDADGAPVAGALVGARGRDSQRNLSLAQARTDELGRFLLADLTPGLAHRLLVVAPGHGRLALAFTTGGPGTTRDLGDVALPRPRAVEGRVLLPDGAAASGVLVELEGPNDDGDEQDRPDPATESRLTDDLGRFRFPDQSAGTYALRALPMGRRSAEATVSVPDATGIELRLAGARALAVRVVDTGGAPVPFAQVQALLEDDVSLACTTDADGRARLLDDRRFVEVGAFPLADDARWLPARGRKVPPGATSVELRVRRAGLASGRVLGLDGRPLAQAFFELFEDGRPFDPGGPFGGNQRNTDMQGRFSFPAPVDGAVDLVLVGSGGDGPPFTGGLEGIRAGARGLVVQAEPLRHDRTLAVHVVDPSGAPLQGAQVYAKHAGELVAGANVLTDDEGRASLRGLPNARIAVHARVVPEHPRADDWIAASVVVEPEGQAVTLRLDEAVHVTGIARDAAGDPVARAWVSIYHRGELLQARYADDEGRFALRLGAGTPGPLWLFATATVADGRTLEARVEDLPVADRELELVLGPR